MNKYKLLAGFNILQDKNSQNIIHITNNSKNVKKGSLFIAVKGVKQDGHAFLEDAVKNGAKVILIEDKIYYNNCIIKQYTKSSRDNSKPFL